MPSKPRPARPAEEEDRGRALHALEILDTLNDPRLDRLVRLAKRVFDVPTAVISFVDKDRSWFKSVSGLAQNELPRNEAFCAQVALGDDVFIVPDTTADPAFVDHPLVAGEPFFRFYAGIPIKTPNGQGIGALSVLDTRARIFQEEDRKVLRDLADLAEQELFGGTPMAAGGKSVGAESSADGPPGSWSGAKLGGFLDAVVENIPDMVFVKDAKDLRFVYLNKAGEDLLGMSRRKVIGKNDFDFFPDDQAAFFVEKDRAVLAAGSVMDITKEPIETADKGARWLQTRKLVLFDSTGEPEYLLGISQDITENLDAENALRTANEKAVSANRMKSDFLAHMSHELRTPLNAILGFSEILKREMFGALGHTKYSEYADDIVVSAQYLLELINDVLDISRIEANQAPVTVQQIDLPDLIDGVLIIVRPLAERKMLSVDVRVSEGLPVLCMDGRMLRQALINLLSNGVKFTPANGRIGISAALNDAGGMKIVIEDSGVGIAEKDLQRVLEPFAQVRQSLDQAIEGTGLGLTLSQKFIQLNGGHLDIQSTLGEGTTVTLTFPPEMLRSSGPS